MALSTVYASMSASPVGYAPLLLATITFSDGTPLYLSTRPLSTIEGGSDYGIQYNGNNYLGRLDPQDLARVQALSPQGITLIPSVTLTIADPDGYIYLNYELTAGRGFKGATLTLDLVLYDVLAKAFSSDAVRKYYGTCEQPKRTRTALSVVSASLKNPQRQFLPSVHIQPRCPWNFPTNVAQQQDGADNPLASPFGNCGYSAQGTGANARGNGSFTTCNKTRANCIERGMFDKDSADRVTRRFGGFEWNGPTSFKGKSYIDNKTVIGYNTSNEARFNDLIPLVYGSGWVNLQMLQPLGDPNSTRVEGVLCYGEIGNNHDTSGVLKVVINDVELPFENAKDKLFTWRFVNNTGSTGNRTGGFNTDALYDGKGDPYGSISVIEVVFPASLGGSGSVPSGRAWIDGPKIPVPNSNDTSNSGVAAWPLVATTCPVWILMDLLTWCGYQYFELDIQTWQNAATVCNTNVTYTDQNGNTAAQHLRFKGSLILQASRSAADVIQGVLNSFNGILVPNNDGSLLQLFVRQTLADQQPAPVTGSNYNTGIPSVTALGGASTGFVAFDFNESNIKYATLESVPQTSTESGNQISITFQDEDNIFVQDSVSTVDPYALARSGNQELPSQRPIDCISNFDQATRITNIIFAESFRGNPRGDAGGTIRYQFETGSACLHLRIGHIVRFSNQQDSISNQLFRVEDIQYLPDAESMRLVIAWHSDGWYEDIYGQANDPFYSDPRLDLPTRPCYPWKPALEQATNADLYPAGTAYSSFGLAAGYVTQADGTSQILLMLQGRAPVNSFGAAYPPNVPRQGTTANTGGTILPGNYLVGFSSIDSAGGWSTLSKLVPVSIPGGTTTNTITVGPIYWPPNAVDGCVFLGTNELLLGGNAKLGTLTSSITLTQLPPPFVGPPDVKFDHFHVQVKNIEHAGIIGSALSAVGTGTLQIPGYGASSDDFTGDIVSLLGFAAPVVSGNLPILDSLITASSIDDAGNLNLTLHQDFKIFGVNPGDIVVIRAKSDSITASTIGCAKFINAFSPAGIPVAVAGVGGEAGLLIRIIAGTGAGQERTVESNTATVYTITGTWDTLPDATSIFIACDPTWDTLAPNSTLLTTDAMPDAPVTISNPFIGNQSGGTYLVQVLTEDASGASGPDNYAPIREIYIPGSPGQLLTALDGTIEF